MAPGLDLDPPPTSLRVGICGPVLIVRQGAERVGLASGPRTVLGLLALAAGSNVTLESIADLLWPDGPPPSATGIVHTYISRLRRQLRGDDASSRIIREGSGYRLVLAPDELDVMLFRELAGQAREQDDLQRACGFFERAVRLWRGDPVEDVEALRHTPAAAGLSNERLAATLDYAQCAASAGLHEAVLPHLMSLAPANPLAERLSAALMIALAGSGRQAEALGVYEEIRVRLDEELGISPGDELREALQKVLRQELTVSPARRDDRSYEIRQLPAAPADFTGRDAEIRRLVSGLEASGDLPGVPVWVVCGQPGVGKTALALHVAHAGSPSFPDGQLWVHLAGASAQPRNPGDVLADMLRTLGVPGTAIPDGLSQRSATLRSALAGRRMLVVADDAASADQVLPLMPGTTGCALLITTRIQLHGLPGATCVPLDVLTVAEGVRLLSRILGHERTLEDSAGAADLVTACGGLPLALRIAGGKLASRPRWPVSVMVRGLLRADRRLSELDSGGLSVRASIASSYNTLSERHRMVFQRLAILGPNDFAGWVAGVMLGLQDATGVLNDLVTASLVMPIGVDATGEPRYRLHDLVREYAAEQLADESADAVEALTKRVLHCWLQLARQADSALLPAPYIPRARSLDVPSVLSAEQVSDLTRDAVAWFSSEERNLLAAVERACATGNVAIACDLAGSQYAFQHLQDRFDALERIWRLIGEAAAQSGVQAEEARTKFMIATALVRRGYSTDAVSLLDSSMEQFRTGDDPEALAFAYYWRAACAWDVDDYGDARAYGEAGIREAVAAGDQFAELGNMRIVGLSLALAGEASGLEYCEKALRTACQLDSITYEIHTIHSLALACCHVGQPERSLKLLPRLLLVTRQVGDVRTEATALGVMADSYVRLGRLDDAVAALRESLRLFASLQAERHLGLCLLKLGTVYERTGELVDATTCLRKSLAIFRSLKLEHKAEMATQALARCRTAHLGVSRRLPIC